MTEAPPIVEDETSELEAESGEVDGDKDDDDEAAATDADDGAVTAGETTSAAGKPQESAKGLFTCQIHLILEAAFIHIIVPLCYEVASFVYIKKYENVIRTHKGNCRQ